MQKKMNKAVIGNSDPSSITPEEVESLVTLNYLLSSAILEITLNVNRILKLPEDTAAMCRLNQNYDSYFMEIEHVSHMDTGQEAIKIKPIKRTINH